jgi:hypothetical protein
MDFYGISAFHGEKVRRRRQMDELLATKEQLREHRMARLMVFTPTKFEFQ